jgi:hypothetical protein
MATNELKSKMSATNKFKNVKSIFKKIDGADK